VLIWQKLPQGWMAVDAARGRCVAGWGWHWYRPWLYPLYTPGGRQVLEAFPFDHPFHNGCFVGLHPVVHMGRHHNFWGTPPMRQPSDPLTEDLGRVSNASEPLLSARGGRELQAELDLHWLGCDGTLLLREHRSIHIESDHLENRVHLRCEWKALVTLSIPATKFAGIGVRLDPALTPACGARYAAVGRRGGLNQSSVPQSHSGNTWAEAAVSAQDCSLEDIHGREHEAVRVESAANPDAGWGLLMHTARPGAPWFVRSYGLALHNPLAEQGLELVAGESMRWSLGLVAYDVPNRVPTR
jgi:hypothetical protein